MLRSRWAACLLPLAMAAACASRSESGGAGGASTSGKPADGGVQACTNKLPIGQLVTDEPTCVIDPETSSVDQCTFERHDAALNQWIATCDAASCECRFVPGGDAGASCATSCASGRPQANCCPSPWT